MILIPQAIMKCQLDQTRILRSPFPPLVSDVRLIQFTPGCVRSKIFMILAEFIKISLVKHVRKTINCPTGCIGLSIVNWRMPSETFNGLLLTFHHAIDLWSKWKLFCMPKWSFIRYTLMQFYDSRPTVLWSKWPLASSLLQAIKTCRQACSTGYLMHVT